MRSMLMTLALGLAPMVVQAQERDSTPVRRGLARDIAREAADLYNAPAAIRASARTEIAAGQTVRGDVSVIDGPVVIAGHVTGRVLAINADVTLRPTARIDGDLLVVGGEVIGRNEGYVGGEIRSYRQRMAYTREGDRIVADRRTASANRDDRGNRGDQGDEPTEDSWWRRWERRRYRSSTGLRLATAGAYNRTEGLPIKLGPSVHLNYPSGSFRLDAHAILRTGSSFNSTKSDVGHDVSTEWRFGRRGGLGIGAHAFNVAEPVESWQLSNLEVGLASFLARRDYRDYYDRHGGEVFATLFATRRGELTAGFSDEHWGRRDLRNPWTLTRRDDDWRANPLLDEGRLHVASAQLTIDTRNNRNDPWSGWFATLDWERGVGKLTQLGPSTVSRNYGPNGAVDYTRGFADLRRYNRLAPDAQLNFRVVLGGWLNGDPLPLQRRLSIDGPGSVPGFDFRTTHQGEDVGTCGATSLPIAGMPAQCDRIALAQVEYRGDLHIDLFSAWDDGDEYRAFNHDGNWVLFADAGRGWLVGPRATDLTYPKSSLPEFGTFRTDIGAGIDFDAIGVFAARSMSDPKEAVNFFLRIRHRF
ncbi:MAG: hypothetical protein JWO05_620 [Gemmatimonadetes bacterium]|nr:hypothetical protein [Gemmatimonadota bacterium]